MDPSISLNHIDPIHLAFDLVPTNRRVITSPPEIPLAEPQARLLPSAIRPFVVPGTMFTPSLNGSLPQPLHLRTTPPKPNSLFPSISRSTQAPSPPSPRLRVLPDMLHDLGGPGRMFDVVEVHDRKRSHIVGSILFE